MRGYRTLKCRFNLASLTEQDVILEVTIDTTLAVRLSARDHVVFTTYTVDEERTLQRRQTVFQMSLAEAERLIGFLDAGLLEHRRRLTAVEGLTEEPAPPSAVETVPPIRPPIPGARPNTAMCEVCANFYSSDGDVIWRPDYRLYICDRNYTELLEGRLLTGSGGHTITPQPVCERRPSE